MLRETASGSAIAAVFVSLVVVSARRARSLSTSSDFDVAPVVTGTLDPVIRIGPTRAPFLATAVT